MRLVALLVSLSACTVVFPLEEPPPPDLSIDVPHLGLNQIGEADAELVDATIDTDLLRAGDFFLETEPHLATNFDVAVLRGDRIVFRGMINVVGARPLVVIGRSIIVEGVLDAGARGAVPGAGGVSIEAGNGFGGNGQRGGSNNSGGGGGGHGGSGANGGGFGVCPTPETMGPGGAGGTPYGDPEISVLLGGAPGGFGEAPCDIKAPTGAGGGAIQLSALELVEVSNGAAINAGGGGGGGGLHCGGVGATDGGSGGGAGGSLYLDAPTITVLGTIAANGGGGGSGSGKLADNLKPGLPGQDGGPSLVAAQGGTAPVLGQATNGGAGGVRDTDPTPGTSACKADAGGGGGGVGRIVQRGTVTSVGTATPTPTAVAR